MRKYDLDQRLINFTISIIHFAKRITQDYAGEHLKKQIIRASSSATLNYAEAMGAASSKDFIHKLKICEKELRECFIILKIIQGAKLHHSEKLEQLKNETNQLISIFVKSIVTTQKNQHSLIKTKNKT